MRYHPLQRTFQLSHVGPQSLCNKQGRIIGQFNARLRGLIDQNGRPGLELRGFHRYRQPPTKTGFESFFEAIDLFVETITSEDYLLPALQ